MNLYRNDAERTRLTAFEELLPTQLPEGWVVATKGVRRLNDYKTDAMFVIMYRGPNLQLQVVTDALGRVTAFLTHGNGVVPSTEKAKAVFGAFWPACNLDMVQIGPDDAHMRVA